VTLTLPPRDFAPPHQRVAADSRVVGGVLGRYAILAVGAVALGALHLRHRPSTICPFRALTGLPCPFCGGTTAASQLGHGDLRAALAASPLALVLLGIWPLVGAVSPPHWWRRRRLRIVTIVVIVIASELWQLGRFGYL
jgi:uncharacterized protein DUF2752